MPAHPIPHEPGESPPLLFLHIPRTGGSTLKFMLRAVFGMERSLVDAHLYRTDDEDLREYAFVEGHQSAAFFANRFGSQWHSNGVTMLRDPVARAVSQARHIRERPGPFQHYLRKEVSDPAEAFERIPQLSNFQTKLLSYAPVGSMPVGGEALEQAKKNLDRLTFGITEAFDASMALVVDRFDLRIPRFGVVNAAKGTGDDDLRSDEFRAMALGRNDLDCRLYEYAERTLRSRVSSFSKTLLSQPANDAVLTCGVRFGGRPVSDGTRIPSEEVCATLEGWALIEGRAADAVLVRVGEQVTPLVPGVEREDVARSTRDLRSRHAGFAGTVTVPPDAQALALIAFDRRRCLRGERVFELVRVDEEHLTLRRLAAASSARLKHMGRARHRS